MVLWKYTTWSLRNSSTQRQHAVKATGGTDLADDSSVHCCPEPHLDGLSLVSVWVLAQSKTLPCVPLYAYPDIGSRTKHTTGCFRHL